MRSEHACKEIVVEMASKFGDTLSLLVPSRNGVLVGAIVTVRYLIGGNNERSLDPAQRGARTPRVPRTSCSVGMAGGLKSELKRTEQSFAKQQEDEEEEEEDSSVIRTVGRNFLRFVYALVVFGVLLVGSAYVLWIYERPIEERPADARPLGGLPPGGRAPPLPPGPERPSRDGPLERRSKRGLMVCEATLWVGSGLLQVV